MACLSGSNLNSTPFASGISRHSSSISQLRRACVRIGAIRSGLGEGKERPEFVYTRAKPEVRWPHKSDELLQQRIAREVESARRPRLPDWEELSRSEARLFEEEAQDVARDGGGDGDGEVPLARRLEREEMVRKRESFRLRHKGQVKRLQSMSKLALRKATDLKNKGRRLSSAICSLDSVKPVTDVLDSWPEQLNNEELSVVVRNVGDQNWQRALELYEWLNLRKWYTPNPRQLATILHILGRANQLESARELFLKAEPELTSCIQVFNAILGVYAKQGKWEEVEQILELIEQRGCEPDIITFNTIANARCKYDLQTGMASALLREIENAGLRPDIITYNTLLGGCIANKNFSEAAEIVNEMERRGFDLNDCTSYVLGKKYLSVGEGENPVLSTLDELSLQQALSNDVQSISEEDTVQQTITPMVEGTMRKYVTSNINRIELSRLEAGDSHQMVTPYLRSSEAGRPADESRFSTVCLFMRWKIVHPVSPVDQVMQSLRRGLVLGSERLGRKKLTSYQIHVPGLFHTTTRKTYKQLHLCKAASVPLSHTEHPDHTLSDVGQLDSELALFSVQETSKVSAVTASVSSYTKLMNECLMKKDYSTALEKLAEMLEAGIEPSYMSWICVLQACGQCANRIDLLRLLAALRDAGCPLPLRLIMEREAALAEVEDWFRNLHATAADAGQGMVNVLVDILWAFKFRALAGHIYSLALCLDMYPRNFARVEEHNWEADFRNFSPGTALVALNHWFLEMQKASLDGLPEPPKEVLMITGTQGYQNGVSLNKTLRAHLWEMGSPFYMRPPREGALISRGHALRLWLKDSPRCFNLDLEDSVIIPKVSSMSFFKGAWMSSDAVPVMNQIHTSIGEVWPRKYSKLAHMSETRRIEALAARIENEKRRRLEKREKPSKPIKKKKRPLRRKE